MYQIEYDKAIELLLKGNLPLHYDAYYDVYKELEEVYQIDCFKAHGFLIFKVYLYDYYYERSFPHIYLHQIEDEADLDSAVSFVQDDPQLEEKYALFAFIPHEAPEKYAECGRTLKLVSSGKVYDDSSIRELTVNDTNIINELAAVSGDTSDYEKRICRKLTDWFERHDLDMTRIYGVFEGKTLMGVISLRCFKDVGLTMPEELYVNHSFRNHGYGTRLVKAAVAQSCDMTAIYHVDSKNDYSLKIAKSLGFEFIGEMIRIT